MMLTIQRPVPAALCLMACVAWISINAGAGAQGFSTTTVQGTVYLANGQPGSGVLQLSWPAFTTAGNQAVAAGRTTMQIGADGYLSVNLAPNLGATPAGLYYTAVYHLGDGTTSTEYWVVPAAAQASLAQVRAQVMPAAQAVQAVSRGYVDQSIAELTQSLLTASGGSLSGPLYLNGDPTQPTQAATKRYVDNGLATALPLNGGALSGPLFLNTDPAQPAQAATKRYVDGEFAMALPLGGGAAIGPLTGVQLGAAYQADQFQGADFGAKLQACVNKLDPVYGGTCDARNFTGTQAAGSAVVISAANATVQLPCATIATASQIQITPGTRNVTLRGCALRGASNSSGSQGGTVFLYSGSGPMIQVGDPSYAIDTLGFHIDNVVINTTASTGAAQSMKAYRTQEMELEGLYLLGNSNQTGMTLDGTGNYTGGTFQDIEFDGFGTALNGIGHQVTNAATTDWVNASTFLRLHINCPTTGGSPIAGTYGINLSQGDGNTFTGGDVEGCATALHLGPNAQNNTIVGLRNENSINQVVADAGSSYNNWITGGTMFTGQLTDNGTRNSFLDTFHRSFNGLNGDWYGSQTDSTITNHYRLGTGMGNERGLLNRYQTDYGYRWTMGLSDATSGAQFYQLLDELNNVYRLSIGQYNVGQSSTNNQTVINAAGTGAVVLNGSTNAGTGGVIFGAGGTTGSSVATINNAGNAQFNGTLQVGGASTFINSTTVKNQADAEIDSILWAGATANQKESLIYKDYTGASQWYMVKDASNNWALNSAIGGLDSFKAYQSNNSGDTYINASNGSGHIRLNYESGAGAETDIYSGPSSTLVAAFLGNTAIKFPGLAASNGRNCLQIDNSGYISNTGAACATNGMNGTVSAGSAGQVAFYSGNGTIIAGTTSVAVSAGGTGATTATQALQNLGAQAAMPGVASDGASGITITGNIAAGQTVTKQLEGALQADQYQTGGGNNGIVNSLTRCLSQSYVCSIVAPALYAQTETQPWGGAWSWATGTTTGPVTGSSLGQFLDQRWGVPQYVFNSPTSYDTRHGSWPSFVMNFTGLGSSALTGTYTHPAGALLLQANIWAGTHSFYNDKTEVQLTNFLFNKWSEAQAGGILGVSANCYGAGDCVGDAKDLLTRGGYTQSDEAVEGTRWHFFQDTQVPTATVAAVSVSSGVTSLTTNAQTNITHLGGDIPVIITTPAKVYNTGYVSSITTSGGNIVATCSGCALDSTFGTTQQTILTAAIANPGSTNAFPQANVVASVASTAPFTTGKNACIWDYHWDCSTVTAIGSGTITLAQVVHPHPSGAWVTGGGLGTGYGVEMEYDRVLPSGLIQTDTDAPTWTQTLRQVYPIMENLPGNQLVLFQGINTLPGGGGSYTGRAYPQMGGSGGTCSVTVSGGQVSTITATGGTGYISYQNPPQLVISGITYTAAPSVYVTATSSGAVTGAAIANPGAGISGTPTCTVVTSNPFDIYQMATVISPYDATAGTVDGNFTTETFPSTPSAGDTIEQPDSFQEHVTAFGTNNANQLFPTQSNYGRVLIGYKMGGATQGNDHVFDVSTDASPLLYQGYPLAAAGIPGQGQWVTPDYMRIAAGAYRRVVYSYIPPFAANSGYNPALVWADCFIACSNWTQPYYLVGGLGSAQGDGWQLTPATDTLTAQSVNLDLSQVTNVNLGTRSISTTGSLSSGQMSNWNANSNNFAAASWGYSGSNPFTSGQTDPFGGTNATRVGWASNTSQIFSIAPTTNLTAGANYSGSVWMKGATGTEQICFGVASSQFGCQLLTTSWARYPFTLLNIANANLNRTFYFYLNPNTSTGTFYIYNPVTEAGTFSSSSLISTAQVTTPTANNQIAGSNICTQATGCSASLGTQSANAVLAGPASGSPAAPTFRALTNADLPTAASNNAPLWLQYLGSGADGANTNAGGSLCGEKYYTNFTVPYGNTVTVCAFYGGAGLVIHATGTCTIAGTITSTGTQGFPWGGGIGGGGGGGTAAGSASPGVYFSPMGSNAGNGGAAGGGAATTNSSAPNTNTIRSELAGGYGIDMLGAGGGSGGNGGSSGGAGGASAAAIVLICASITGTDGTHTGSIAANGSNGTAASANNTGGGGGGGGGIIVLSSQSTVSTWPTLSVTGGTGGGCGAFTGCGAGANGGSGWTATFNGW